MRGLERKSAGMGIPRCEFQISFSQAVDIPPDNPCSKGPHIQDRPFLPSTQLLDCPQRAAAAEQESEETTTYISDIIFACVCWLYTALYRACYAHHIVGILSLISAASGLVVMEFDSGRSSSFLMYPFRRVVSAAHKVYKVDTAPGEGKVVHNETPHHSPLAPFPSAR